MTDKPDNSADKSGWSSSAIAGAAIGSAALAAALLFVSRRRDAAKAKTDPVHPETAPETD
ncbi:MAG: hypothetical protein M3N34_09065 [Pseudomonadota bacterium]|nr:hypothetical protein [Pseudomonadota bacterium]